MQIQHHIVELVKQYDALDRDDPEVQKLVDQLRLIGRTAAFFGGYAGMIKLHDAAEALVGKNNSVGYHLNQLWDGIGGWWA